MGVIILFIIMLIIFSIINDLIQRSRYKRERPPTEEVPPPELEREVEIPIEVKEAPPEVKKPEIKKPLEELPKPQEVVKSLLIKEKAPVEIPEIVEKPSLKFDRSMLRQAIVWAEIVGPPRAKRRLH